MEEEVVARTCGERLDSTSIDWVKSHNGKGAERERRSGSQRDTIQKRDNIAGGHEDANHQMLAPGVVGIQENQEVDSGRRGHKLVGHHFHYALHQHSQHLDQLVHYMLTSMNDLHPGTQTFTTLKNPSAFIKSYILKCCCACPLNLNYAQGATGV